MKSTYTTYIVPFALVDKLQKADVDCFAVEGLNAVLCDDNDGAAAFFKAVTGAKLGRRIKPLKSELNLRGWVGKHQVIAIPHAIFRFVLRDMQIANTTRYIADCSTKDPITVKQLVNACRISCKITTRTTSRP